VCLDRRAENSPGFNTENATNPGVILTPHDTATCRLCGHTLLYGVKEEPTGWKVLVECGGDGCSVERSVGRVPASTVDGRDAVYERAEAMVTRL